MLTDLQGQIERITYTNEENGYTRGKKLVVMVGSKRALAIGIGNDKTRKRYTYLRNRLSL